MTIPEYAYPNTVSVHRTRRSYQYHLNTTAHLVHFNFNFNFNPNLTIQIYNSCISYPKIALYSGFTSDFFSFNAVRYAAAVSIHVNTGKPFSIA